MLQPSRYEAPIPGPLPTPSSWGEGIALPRAGGRVNNRAIHMPWRFHLCFLRYLLLVLLHFAATAFVTDWILTLMPLTRESDGLVMTRSAGVTPPVTSSVWPKS